jgi:hypothetical protein
MVSFAHLLLLTIPTSRFNISVLLYFLVGCVPSISMFHNMIEFIQSKVIDNINFHNYLELVPEVRELVNEFYARYDASELSISPSISLKNVGLFCNY